jgi:YadA-like membrane anchor domain
MKFNTFVGTAGLGALSVALLSTSALAQSTPLNVPKSVDEYKAAVDAGDACTESYEIWLNRAQCQAKLDAETFKTDELDPAQETVDGEKETYETAVAEDEAALQALKDEEAAKKTDVETAESDLAAAKAEIVGIEGQVEAAALEVNSAEKALIPKATAAGLTVADYVAANPDDDDVVSYTEKSTAYNEKLTELQTAREPIEGLETAVEDAKTALADASDAVTNFEPAADRSALTAAEEELATKQSQYDELAAAGEKPLAPGEDANYDLLTDTKNANNPAKAVLAAAECVANPDSEACVTAETLIGKDDVGQAIVDGFDQLYKADTTLQTNIDTVQANVDKEVADRKAADTTLQQNIDKEVADRKAADVVLQQNIDKEVADRKAADVVLQANIDKEVTDRKAADVVLQQNIDKEVTDRKAADTTLQNNINAEVAARTAADVTLQNNINTVNTRVTQLGERVDSLTKESRQGIAMAMALAAIPTVNYGKFSLGLGVGTFASETAAALGMDFVVSERVKFKLGVTTTGDETGGSAGIAIGF